MALTREQRKRFDGFFPLDGTEYFEPPQPLVDGLIPKHEYTLLTGQPKVGKSTFAAHLTYSVATGETFFGREVHDSGTVLYVAMERAYQTQARINKLFELGERAPRNIILIKPQESQMKSLFFNSENHEEVHTLIERIETSGIEDIKLIIIDSLENTLIGSDSESKDAGPWCNGLQMLLEHFETTGLVLHHETKNSDGDAGSNSAYRGSSVFFARSGMWLRALYKGKNQVRLKAQRGNFGADWEQCVGFNDFGLYTDSMPELSADKKPTQVEFVQARLVENPIVSPATLLDIVRRHPNNQWPNIEAAQISKAIRSMKPNIVEHPDPKDGRSKLLEFVG